MTKSLNYSHQVKNQALCKNINYQKIDQIVQDPDKRKDKNELNKKEKKEAKVKARAYNLNSIDNM